VSDTKDADTATTAGAGASWSQTRDILRVITIVFAVAATLWILYALRGVILLVVLAIFFAYLVAPLVEGACRPVNLRGRQRVVPRALAIGVVYLLSLGPWLSRPPCSSPPWAPRSPSWRERLRATSTLRVGLMTDLLKPRE
jgi:hypothetical protein